MKSSPQAYIPTLTRLAAYLNSEHIDDFAHLATDWQLSFSIISPPLRGGQGVEWRSRRGGRDSPPLQTVMTGKRPTFAQESFYPNKAFRPKGSLRKGCRATSETEGESEKLWQKLKVTSRILLPSRQSRATFLPEEG